MVHKVFAPFAARQAWFVGGFDSITQTFSWEVYDVMDEPLTLTLPFRQWTKESIKILEQLSPPKDRRWRFVVKLALEDEKLFVEPISILRAEDRERPVFNLAFDTLAESGNARVSGSTKEDDDEFEPEEENVLELSVKGSLSKVLSEVNRRLEAIAETGIQTGLAAHRDWLIKSHREVHGFGLTALAKVLDALSRQSSPASTVVKARYLTHLHSQATAHLRS